MRLYSLAWETLRDKGEVSLASTKVLRERYHKALRKEAAADANFNELVRHRGGKYYISKTWVGTQVTFRLVWTTPCIPPIRSNGNE